MFDVGVTCDSVMRDSVTGHYPRCMWAHSATAGADIGDIELWEAGQLGPAAVTVVTRSFSGHWHSIGSGDHSLSAR